MQKKCIAFLIVIIGLGIFFLGMLKTNLTCNKTSDICILRSSIPALHMNLDSMDFKLSELMDIECIKRTQASRGSGKRSYFELTLDISGEPYVLETCPNLKICKRHANYLLDYKNLNKASKLDYISSIGVSNIMGMIMGAALIIFGLKIFFDKTIPMTEEE